MCSNKHNEPQPAKDTPGQPQPSAAPNPTHIPDPEQPAGTGHHGDLPDVLTPTAHTTEDVTGRAKGESKPVTENNRSRDAVAQTPTESQQTITTNVLAILTLVIGGVVGYFSGIAVLQSQISELSNRVVSLETVNDSTQPKLDKLDQYLREINLLKERIALYETKDETSELIVKNLELRLQSLQLDTIAELRQLLELRSSQ